MSEFTPTTDEVRARYCADEFGHPAALTDPCLEFDRWLEAHDREVAAKALRDAAHSMRRHKQPGHWNLTDELDPDNAAQSPDAWLERRAQRIPEGEHQ